MNLNTEEQPAIVPKKGSKDSLAGGQPDGFYVMFRESWQQLSNHLKYLKEAIIILTNFSYGKKQPKVGTKRRRFGIYFRDSIGLENDS